MNCPVCQSQTLIPIALHQNLPAQECSQCHGIWLASTAYFTWLKQHGANLAERPAPGLPLPPLEDKRAKICPDCGHILRRYKIWPEVDFYLDHCSTCNGVWLDRGEWVILEARNLHDDLNQFFTKTWQQNLHEEETRRRLERHYLDFFGPHDYDRIQEVRAWLQRHPQRSALLAFLQAEDPYQ